MQLKVVKFGGSSLADAEHFIQVANILKADPTRRYVVASAPGKRSNDDEKVTDMLYNCYNMIRRREDITEYYQNIIDRYTSIIRGLNMDFDISGELEYIKSAMMARSGRDYAASRGEYLNGLILAKYLGYDFIDAENVIFFKENSEFDEERTNIAMREELLKHERAVVPGFYGSMPNGTIKTFSRGGSDFTGSIIARAMGADLYENWTDVSGFLMADPRIVKNPKPISVITYRELRELSYMGAGVLHEDAIFPVQKEGIAINIKNTNHPEDVGTMILPSADDLDIQHIVTGIAGKKGFSVINIEKNRMGSQFGFAAKVFKCLDQYNIHCEHLPSGIDTMCPVVSTAELEVKMDEFITELHRVTDADSITVDTNLSLIAVVGRGMKEAKGTAARVFTAISNAGVNVRMIDQGSSELNIIIAVYEDDYEKTIKTIYEEFVKE
jgi:aspartate kinase